MTQEDKNLLFHDLCTRLPYGVKVWNEGNVFNIDYISSYGEIHLDIDDDYTIDVSEVKPCLFPISSMTEEQKKEYYSLADDVTIKPGLACCLGIKIHCIKLGISDNPHEEVWDYIDLDALDWLNKNHFDYRGLIEKGLAIDATGLNIYRYHPSN